VSPLVVGLDLSITSTGWATVRAGAAPVPGLQITGSLVETGRIESKPPPALIPRSRPWYRSSIGRITHLSREVCRVATNADLIMIEGAAVAAKGNAVDRMFAMWWMVMEAIDRETGVPWAVITPQQIKTYMTGKGNGPKDQVLAAVLSRLPGSPSGFDEAEALAAAAMGCDHLGCPLAPMPEKHRATLARVDWPAMTAVT
jgi:Holliday junction resolvasome RuvABC endonuclease subunit